VEIPVVEAAVVDAAGETKDRFGLGYRRELSAEILANLQELDILEVIMDDYFPWYGRPLKELKFLSSQVPVLLHGVSLGLASTFEPSKKILKAIRKVIQTIKPEYWSEHLSFVRACGVEIGHLTAPPYNEITVRATVNNLKQIEASIGSLPLLENISTLVFPPNSTMTEAQWIAEILEKTNVSLLLDLHNLYANSQNFSYSALDFIHSIPSNRIKQIHIAGGKLVYCRDEARILDDHKHRVPEPVWKYLQSVGEYCKQPLDIILEWDSEFPDFSVLLEELSIAKQCLRKGREKCKKVS
jgi:uncharacterized protein